MDRPYVCTVHDPQFGIVEIAELSLGRKLGMRERLVVREGHGCREIEREEGLRGGLGD